MTMRWTSSYLVLVALLDGWQLLPRCLAQYDTTEITVDAAKHESQFFSFITRPDLDAPRYDVTVYNQSALAPGYWFVAPYGIVRQTNNDKAYVAPHIYDGNGELVWSGAAMFQQYNTFDFRVMNVAGVDMLTALYPHGSGAVMINGSYEVESEVYVGVSAVTTNMHEFQVVENGTRGLYLTKHRKKASKEESKAVNYDGGCYVEFNGFEERDIATGEVVFSWSAVGRIPLNESVMYYDGRVHGGVCDGKHAWDYLHLNSVEKLPDGDYLLSARRTYTLYKISHRDKSILWRLAPHGNISDFESNPALSFSGQHDARCLSQNDTHMTISLLDNASGPGPPRKTNAYSRGLVLSINTATMTAEEVIEYSHPQKGLADGRGSFEFLPNGNGFASWRDNALISEYTAEGTLIAEAELPSGLKTYRAHKAPWVGRPKWSPDVHAQSVGFASGEATVVHVSWNGATEVATWDLYQVEQAEGHDPTLALVLSVRRTGFETALVYHGYASHVMVAGLDAEGRELGQSEVIATRHESDTSPIPESEEVKWLRENMHSKTLQVRWGDWFMTLIRDPEYTFLGGIVASVVASLVVSCVWKAWRGGLCRRRQRGEVAYEMVADKEEDLDEDDDDI